MAERNENEYSEYDKPITLEEKREIQNIPQKSINKFSHDDLVKSKKIAYRIYNDLEKKEKGFGVKSPFFRASMGEWRYQDYNPAYLVMFDYGEKPKINYANRDVENDDTGFVFKVDGDVINDSIHYASINGDKKQINQLLGKLDEIAKKAIMLDTRTSSANKQIKKVVQC